MTTPASAGAHTDPRAELRHLRGENRLRAERLRARRLDQLDQRERLREVRESLSLDWVTPYAELLDLTRITGDPLAAGPAAYWHRRQGRNWPVYQTEAELSLLRAPARLLLATNGYAQGLVEGLTSYAVGTGCTYRAARIDDSGDAPRELVDALQALVDQVLERNDWKGGATPGMEQELFGRSIEDGEFVLCHYFGEDGWTDFRVQEPEQLTMPPGADWREYSFGIRTPVNDAAKHLRYYLQYGETPSEGEEYDPDEVTHFRRNVRRNMKRGVTDFCFDAYDALHLAGRLRTNLGDTAAQQAAIVAVRQHDNASQEDVQAFVEADADFTKNDPLTYREQQIKLRRRGGWEDIPKGQNYVPGPIATATPIHIQVLDACLRGAGQKWQAPPWLMSGDLNAMNYATSLTAESPFVKTILRKQGDYCAAFRRAIWLAVRHRVRTRGLRDRTGRVWSWEEVQSLCQLAVTAPSPETRNKLEEAQRAAVEIPLGVQSRQAYMQEQGRDADRIEADNREYADKFGQGGAGGQPGAGPVQAESPEGNPPGFAPPAGDPGSEPPELPRPESLLEDEHAHGPPPFPGAVLTGDPPRWHSPHAGERSPGQGPTPSAPHETGPTGADRAAAAHIVSLSKVPLPPEKAAEYADHFARAIHSMPPEVRSRAARALSEGKVAFHPDLAALTAAASEATGRKERGPVGGFVAYRPGTFDAVELHLDGAGLGLAAPSIHAHELWHLADISFGQGGPDRLTADPAWVRAWESEIGTKRPAAKKGISAYAATNEKEGFAELGREIHERGLAAVERDRPKCVAFLRKKGLL